MIKMVVGIGNSFYRFVCQALTVCAEIATSITGINYKRLIFPLYQIRIIAIT